ncbi:MAG: hypothetical protein AAFV53_37155 [Myxococcota bacterium]
MDDFLAAVRHHVEDTQHNSWNGLKGWTYAFVKGIDGLPDVAPLVDAWEAVPASIRDLFEIEMARRDLIPRRPFSAALMDQMVYAEMKDGGRAATYFESVRSLWPEAVWNRRMLEIILRERHQVEPRLLARYLALVDDPYVLLSFLYAQYPNMAIWEVCEARFDELGPIFIEDAEARFLAGPDAIDPDLNDGQRLILGTMLALYHIRRGQPFPERYDIYLAMACQRARDDHHGGEASEHFFTLLLEIFAALPLDRREHLCIQNDYQNRHLTWRLATASKTLTPQIARRAVWKLADLANRRNGGGTYTSPQLTDHERRLFSALGAIAVPEIMREIDAGARRKEFLVKVLCETRCPEAAAPLVRLLGEGGKTTRRDAQNGIKELIDAGFSDAIRTAAEAQTSAKRKGLRLAAATALEMLNP